MASLRGATLALLGGIVGTVPVGLTFMGCGGDDVTPVEDSGADVTTDSATPDTGHDAVADVTTGDVNSADVRVDVRADVTADASDAAGDVTADVRDAAPEADVRVPDADAGPADADASPDSGADADASNIPPGLLAYPQQYATAICTGFATCCGATFDLAKCESSISSQGYDNTMPLATNRWGAGNLTFNQGQAAACLTALQTWPCGATLSSAQSQAILSACHSVLGGTIPIGGTGCVSSFECVSGAYCNTAGTCTALAGNGGACTPGESIDYQCSYIGSAQPALYCSIYPGDGGLTPTGTCAPVLPDSVTSLCSDGMNFYSDYACTNRLCDFSNTGTCAGATANPADPAAGFECASYVLVDAGGD